MLQLTPDPVGSKSFNVAAVAVPAPELLTAIVYPIDAPTVTIAASAVLARIRLGH
jgi:hypothetical protein